ncbi:MAG: glycosyltransferase [Pyrinomonadaceae bacterium]
MDHRMMNGKPTILFYCQHSLGLGHLVRSFALADSLRSEFRVLLLNGGKLPRKIGVPTSIEILNLPPLGFDGDGKLASRDKRRTVEQAQTIRQKLILNTYRSEKPDIILIELFPFGRKKFADELLPLLEEAKGKSKIVCSLRDILVGNRKDQERHDTRAVETANRFFDAILVHSDPTFARLDETFQTEVQLHVPVHYTGFIAPKEGKLKGVKMLGEVKKIIVSAGGGIVGKELIKTAIEASKILAKRTPVETTIAGGLFLPEKDWLYLQDLAANETGFRFKRFIPNLRAEMSRSDVSISQCGYNTALDIVLSGVSGIVVPYGTADGEDEQTTRARRLEEIGALRVCENPTPEDLAQAINTAFDFHPKPLSLDFNGGPASTRIIKHLLREKQRPADWLEPVRNALEHRKMPVKVFFRDDDAGIENDRLGKLLDVFESFATPVDIAVIPKEISAEFAIELRRRIEARPTLFSIHQHGYEHVNHEAIGRKCEFGTSRNKGQQFFDITAGRQILKGLFGELPQPIFTPPWNRCTRETGEALVEAGFSVLSRESGAEPLAIIDLGEIPVSIDWFAKRKGVGFTRKQIGETMAEAISTQSQVGIMLHHAVMDEEELFHLSELLRLFSKYKTVELHSIMSLFEESGRTERSLAHVI